MEILLSALVCALIVTADSSGSNSTSIEGKVVLGQAITKGKPPITNFICPVLRVRDANQVATGIFIASNYLLTVAIVLYEFDPKEMRRKLVDDNSLLVAIIYSKDDCETLQVLDHRIHDSFNPNTLEKRHNIAILIVDGNKNRLKGPFPCLPESPLVLNHDTINNGKLYGYRTYEDKRSPLDATKYPVVVQLDIMLQTYKFCREPYAYHVEEDDSYGVCAYVVTASSSIQSKDNGSPFCLKGELLGMNAHSSDTMFEQYAAFILLYQESDFIKKAMESLHNNG